MEGVSITDISYLLFVIPGFVLVWTFRHFTRSQKKIGEFEYAAWSLIWGILVFLIYGLAASLQQRSLPAAPVGDPFSMLGGLTGTSLALITIIALPVGYIGAILSHRGLFKRINSLLFKNIESN